MGYFPTEKDLQGYALLHIAKEAINATMRSIAIRNNIIVQTAPSLRKKKGKLYASLVGYVRFALIALLSEHGNSLEIVSKLPLHTLVCRCTKERLFQIGNSIHKMW